MKPKGFISGSLLAQPNPRYPTEERNRLLLRLMLDTGLRLSEALNLQWRDLDLTTAKLHVKLGIGPRPPPLLATVGLDYLPGVMGSGPPIEANTSLSPSPKAASRFAH